MRRCLFLRASRPSRARGLKRVVRELVKRAAKSRPSRARGLKQNAIAGVKDNAVSRPSRARGLKLADPNLKKMVIKVAPLAGAWIETSR